MNVLGPHCLFSFLYSSVITNPVQKKLSTILVNVQDTSGLGRLPQQWHILNFKKKITMKAMMLFKSVYMRQLVS